jgi:hypothetical protein
MTRRGAQYIDGVNSDGVVELQLEGGVRLWTSYKPHDERCSPSLVGRWTAMSQGGMR